MIDPDTFELSRRLGEALSRAGQRLGIAESCTGGALGAAVTAVPGSSAWFDRGFVTYSNDAKEELLGVPPEILRRHGAVSEETAAAMATGVLVHTAVDVAAAVTGIAGPGGGTRDKPAGTVCLGWARRGGAPRTARVRFNGDRDEVRDQAVAAALEGLLDLLADRQGDR